MRRIILALSMLIGVWLGATISAPSASAATNCNMAVVDFTSDGVLGDTSRIEAAIEKLEDQGVDVRVRAFETTPGGSLEAYQKEQVQICPTWQDPNGHTKGNLMTFLFSMDRQSAIFYGSNLEAELDEDVDRIRADYMNAEFRNGNFSEGIIGAISESANVIDEYNHPSPDVSTEDDNGNDEASPATNHILWWVGVILVSIGFLIGLVFGAVALVQFRRRRKEEWTAANQGAYEAANNAANELLKIKGSWGTLNGAELLAPELNDEDRAELDNLVADFGAVEEGAVAKNNAINDTPTTYSLGTKRSTTEYIAITAAHDEVKELAAEAASILNRIETFCAEKQEAIAKAPETLQARRATLDELTAERDALQQEGYRFTAKESFAKVSLLLERASDEIEAKRYGEALDELDGSEQLLDDIQSTLTRVPEWHQGLQKEHKALTDELGEIKKAMATAMEIRKDISSQFTNCDEGLLSESEAAKLIATVAASLAEAKNECSMEQQEWSAADQQLSQCEQMLSELQQGNEAIVARMDQLTELERDLGSRLDNLDDAIGNVFNSCNSREGSQEEFAKRLGSAVRKLSELEDDLSADKPNLLRIARELHELEAKVKRLDEESEEEDRRVRRRREEEARRRREEEEAERRRRNSYDSSGFGTGFVTGSAFGSSGGGGGFDFGGGSSGGSDGGGSSGSW